MVVGIPNQVAGDSPFFCLVVRVGLSFFCLARVVGRMDNQVAGETAPATSRAGHLPRRPPSRAGRAGRPRVVATARPFLAVGHIDRKSVV